MQKLTRKKPFRVTGVEKKKERKENPKHKFLCVLCFLSVCVSCFVCHTRTACACLCVCVAFLCVYRCVRIELKAKVICQNQLRQQQIKILLALRIRSVRALQRACVCLVCVSVCIFIDCTLSTPRSRIRNALKCHKGKFGQLQRRHRTVAPPPAWCLQATCVFKVATLC